MQPLPIPYGIDRVEDLDVLTAHSSHPSITLLDSSEWDRARPILSQDQHCSSICIVVGKVHTTNLHNPILKCPCGQELLLHQRDFHLLRPLIVWPLGWQDAFQLVAQHQSHPISYINTSIVSANEAHWLIMRGPEKHAEDHKPDSINPSIIPPHFVVASLSMAHLNPCDIATAEQNEEITDLSIKLDTALESKRRSQLKCHQIQNELEQVRSQLAGLREDDDGLWKQSAEKLTCLTKERFDLNNSPRQLQAKMSGDKAVEQMQITMLQQSVEENKALLKQAQSEHQQRESDLRAALDEANRSASEKLSRTKAEFTNQVQSLVEQLQSAKEELAAKEQTNNDAEVKHQKAMASLREELYQARLDITELVQSRQQLDEKLQHEQAASQAQQEQYNETLEAEKEHAREEQARANALVKDLKEQLEASHTKIHKLRRKHVKLNDLLKREHRMLSHLKRLLKTSKEDEKILKQCLADEEQDQQELRTEMQQLIKDNQMAWEKVSEADIATQVAKQELVYLKRELTHQNSILQAQLQYLEESSKLTQSSHAEEIERLQKSLAEYQAAQKVAHAAICSMKKDQQLLHDAKSEFDRQVAELKEESSSIQSALSATIKFNRQEIALLRKKLNKNDGPNADPTESEKLHQELRQAKDENSSLKMKIKELLQVQQEIERQSSKGNETRIRRSLSHAVSKDKQSKIQIQSSCAPPLKRQKRNAIRTKNQPSRLRLRIRNMYIKNNA